MSIRTIDQLEAALTVDLKWRVQEMFVYEKQIENASDKHRPALLRGGTAILYAHWEGYVKTAGATYLEYVSLKGLKLGELRPELAAVAMRSKITALATSKNTESHTELIELLWDKTEEPAKLPFETSTIRTHANLNFKLFSSIMHSLGCDATRHEAVSLHIDERILGARNEIAHGQQEYVIFEDWKSARLVVEGILQDVRTQLNNAAALKEFRRVAA